MNRALVLKFWVGSALVVCHHKNKFAAQLEGITYRIARDTGHAFSTAEVAGAMTGLGFVPGEVTYASTWGVAAQSAFRQLTGGAPIGRE